MIPRLGFGRTGHESTRLIFGAAALFNATPEQNERALGLLLENGINHIDCAASYGHAELRLGEWMPEHRDKFFLATKTGERRHAAARDQIRASLERMQTDRIDLLQLHNLVDEAEWETAFSDDGAVRAAIEARNEGLVRFIGVTGHGTRVAAMHLRSLDRFDFDSVLLPYNHAMMASPEYAEDFEHLLEVCQDREVAVQTIKSVARAPLGGRRAARNDHLVQGLHRGGRHPARRALGARAAGRVRQLGQRPRRVPDDHRRSAVVRLVDAPGRPRDGRGRQGARRRTPVHPRRRRGARVSGTYAFDLLDVALEDGVAFATISNPPINVITLPLFAEIARFGSQVAEDDDVRAVVLRSDDPDFFLAHFDVGAILEFPTDGPAPRGERVDDNLYHAMCETFRTMPKATIAEIGGRVGGGGSELALSFDMRFGALGRTVINQPEVAIGILPGGSGTQRLPRLIGRGRALEVILGCDDLDAETAERWGYLNRALPPAELRPFVTRLAKRIASFPARAVADAKASILNAEPALDAGLIDEAHLFQGLLRTPEAQTLMRRFMERGGQTRVDELRLGEFCMELLDE